MFYVKSIFLTTILALGFVFTTQSQPMSHIGKQDGGAKAVHSLMDKMQIQGEQPLKMVLMTDMNNLVNNRRFDEYQPASLSFYETDGKVSNWDARVKLRGRFRRMNCDFPPLKLDLDKDELEARGLARQDQFKLVTHCLDDEQGQQNILREYLGYKLYNVLTDQSFRVKLVEVTYMDVSGSMEPLTRYGFLIEDVDEMADRLRGEEYEMMNIPGESFDPYQCMLQSMFQFMIANSDFDMAMARNVKFVKLDYSEKVLAVPYDFDFSGLVNASYAIPDPNTNQQSITDRIYKGEKCSDTVVRYTVDYMQSKKEDLLAEIDRTPMLDRSSRRHATKMVESFFHILESEQRVNRLFVSTEKGGHSGNGTVE